MLVLLVIFFPRGLVGTFLGWRGRRLARQAPRSARESRVEKTAAPSAATEEARHNA
jgi:branched-chain amino acid transport system permease protein